MVDLLQGLSVSRETFDKLEHYAQLITKWQKAINLVSKDTIPDLWNRHILDSAQIFHTCRFDWPAKCLDIGSGGGLPGIVIAIMLAERQPEALVTLIESDQRKATFLRTALRETGTAGQVLTARVEDVPPAQAGLISARALASVLDLMPLIERHLAKDGVAVLHKGRNVAEELEAARQVWHFDALHHQSLIHPDGKILELRNITRAQP